MKTISIAFLLSLLTVFSQNVELQSVILSGEMEIGSPPVVVPPPIWFQMLGTNMDTTAGTVYTSSGSYTPFTNALLIAVVVNSRGGEPQVPTFTGNGLTWDLIATTNIWASSSSTNALSVFRTMGSPTSGVGTATLSSSHNGGGMFICQFTNVDTSGTRGAGAIVQVLTTNGTSANPTMTLGALGASSNCVFVASANSVNVYGGSAESGYVEDYDAGYSSPGTGLYFMHQIGSGDVTPLITVGATNWMMICVEIKANTP